MAMKDNCFLEAFNVEPGDVFQVDEASYLIWLPFVGERLLLPKAVAESFAKTFPNNLRVVRDK